MPEPSPKPEIFVGVDFGGTKLLAGVFDQQLRLLGTEKISTKADRGVDAVIDRIARVVRDAVDDCDINLKQVRGIGIGAAGAVDPVAGKVLFAPNLPKWENIALKKELEKRLDVPVFVENDCNACTLGVHEKQLKGKYRHVLGLFLGTGIGGGIMLDGKIYGGASGSAGEVGHMVLEASSDQKCGCGNRGCFEALASRTAMFRQIKEAVKKGEKTLLTDMLGPDLADMRSGDLRKAIRKGDKFVGKIVADAAFYTGIAVGNLINIFNPDVVVLGGGVIDALEDEMLSIIVEVAKDYAMPSLGKAAEIIAAEDADNVGIFGGAVLAKREVK
jgi:glucokinase